MSRIPIIILIIFASFSSRAHPFLDHAIPGVGLTVNYEPNLIQIFFTEDLVEAKAFVWRNDCAASPCQSFSGKTVINKQNGELLEIHLLHPLKSGIYLVNYQITDDEHHEMAGKYKFTVK